MNFIFIKKSMDSRWQSTQCQVTPELTLVPTVSDCNFRNPLVYTSTRSKRTASAAAAAGLPRLSSDAHTTTPGIIRKRTGLLSGNVLTW